MTITFTRGADTFSPWDRLGFDAKQESRTTVRRHLDGSYGYTIAEDGPRAGTMRLLFLSADAAEAARVLLAQPGLWVITDDLAAVSMTIVRSRDLEQVQRDNRRQWHLDVGFTEVLS